MQMHNKLYRGLAKVAINKSDRNTEFAIQIVDRILSPTTSGPALPAPPPLLDGIHMTNFV